MVENVKVTPEHFGLVVGEPQIVEQAPQPQYHGFEPSTIGGWTADCCAGVYAVGAPLANWGLSLGTTQKGQCGHLVARMPSYFLVPVNSPRVGVFPWVLTVFPIGGPMRRLAGNHGGNLALENPRRMVAICWIPLWIPAVWLHTKG